MLMSTKPGGRGGDWVLRVAGDDPAEVAAAAKLIGAAVNVSRGGRYWFRCRADQLPTIRDAHGVCDADLAGWLWWARPREETRADTSGGVFSVDLPDEPGGVQPDAGVNPAGGTGR